MVENNYFMGAYAPSAFNSKITLNVSLFRTFYVFFKKFKVKTLTFNFFKTLKVKRLNFQLVLKSLNFKLLTPLEK